MHNTFSISLDSDTKQKYSCTRCFKRKVKCDREAPCGACVKHNTECVFRHHLPPRSRGRLDRRKTQFTQPNKVDTPRVASILDAVIAEPSQQVPAYGDKATIQSGQQLPTPSSVNSESEHTSIQRSQLLQTSGRTAFVDNSLWSRVAEEINDPGDEEYDTSQESYEEAEEDEQLFALGGTPDSHRWFQHPSNTTILRLWDTYKKNVDPLVKIVHCPTLGPAIEKAIENPHRIPRGFEALMCAIYGIAIMTLPDAECEDILQESRGAGLSRYTAMTRLALSRANFISTTSLVVLQALYLYIFTIRETSEPRLIFNLNGIALRIAESMGLHRDGSSLGLSPFEAEMRRRIWWQMKLHDWRTAQLAGLNNFKVEDVHPDRPSPPANVNDDQIFPSMTQPVACADGATDMIFCLLRIEFGSHAASPAVKMVHSNSHGNNWDDTWSRQDAKNQEEMIKEFQDRIESKYLRYCDPTEPLHLMAMILARSISDFYRFISHHPRKWSGTAIPESERQFVWQVSLKLIEKFNMAQSNLQLKHLAWHSYYHMHWDVIIHILDTLGSFPLLHDAQKAWQSIQTIYQNNPQIMSDTKKLLHATVNSLCLKAYDAGQDAREETGEADKETPQFILLLREKRESARMERSARTRKREHAQAARRQQNHKQSVVDDQKVFGAQDIHAMPQHSASWILSDEINRSALDDNFWFDQSFDNNSLGIGNGSMDYVVLGPELDVDSDTDHAFDWAHWDMLVSKNSFSMS